MKDTKQIDRNQCPAYPLRMPNELKKWLTERAAVNRRSFNSEVVVMLEQVQKSEATNAQT